MIRSSRLRTPRLLALILVFVVLATAGCGGGSSPPSPPSAPAAQGQPGAGSGAPATAAGGKQVELNFYYPVAVGGPITKIVEAMVADFMAANPGIKVTPVFSGSYNDTLTKVQTLIQGGQAPEVAVLLSTDIYTLIDQDAIVPLDSFIQKDPDGKAFMDDFFPAFMRNSVADGKVWGIPFQRSTVVLYWNKDLFKAAGLNPDQPPKNWQELVDFAKRVNRPDQGVWGLKIPSDGYPYWLLQGFAIQSGRNLMDDTGKNVYFNSAENVKALEFFVSLAKTHKVMPEGVIAWAATPTDFLGGKAAMIYHTTGSLTNIKKNAQFPFGVAFLPAGDKGYGTPTGGGNLYVFNKISPEKQAAAWKFVRFMTQPERLAQWSMDTGYIAPRKSSYETVKMKDFIAQNPEYLVAREQLQHAQAELSVHNNPQVYKAYNDKLQAIVTGRMGVKEALDGAQKESEQILAPFRK